MENDPQHYVTGVLGRNRLTLARTITLIESTLPSHQELARTIVERLLPHTGCSIRIGIAAPPGREIIPTR